MIAGTGPMSTDVLAGGCSTDSGETCTNCGGGCTSVSELGGPECRAVNCTPVAEDGLGTSGMGTRWDIDTGWAVEASG